MTQTPSLVLIFDGYCGVCTRLAHWVEARGHRQGIVAAPSQQPGLRERFNLTREQTDGAAWAIQPEGRRWQGAAAINQIFSELGGPWALIALPYRLPPLAWLEDRAYYLFAQHRGRFSRFGVTPACERPNANCLPG